MSTFPNRRCIGNFAPLEYLINSTTKVTLVFYQTTIGVEQNYCLHFPITNNTLENSNIQLIFGCFLKAPCVDCYPDERSMLTYLRCRGLLV